MSRLSGLNSSTYSRLSTWSWCVRAYWASQYKYLSMRTWADDPTGQIRRHFWHIIYLHIRIQTRCPSDKNVRITWNCFVSCRISQEDSTTITSLQRNKTIESNVHIHRNGQYWQLLAIQNFNCTIKYGIKLYAERLLRF